MSVIQNIPLSLYLSNFRFGKINDRDRSSMENQNVIISRNSNNLQKVEVPEFYSFQNNKTTLEDFERLQNPIHIKPRNYVHILNNNNGKMRCVCGPKTETLKADEKLIFGPAEMITIPENYYCVIENPVLSFDQEGNVQDIAFGKKQVRSFEKWKNPFPLQPNEKLISKMEPEIIILENAALLLEANCDCILEEEEDQDQISNNNDKKNNNNTKIEKQSNKKIAKEQWLLHGPRSYIPNPNVKVISVIIGITIKENQAVRLKAVIDHIDQNGKKRHCGEEFLYKNVGNFIPLPSQSFISLVEPIVLKNNIALHLRAISNLIDCTKTPRKTGSEWLITSENCSLHLLEIEEELVEIKTPTSLNSNQYCVVKDIIDSTETIVQGPKHFFLQPNQQIVGKVNDCLVLEKSQCLHIKVLKDDENYKAGQKFYLYGPVSFIPKPNLQILGKYEAKIQIDFLGLYLFYL